MNKKNTIRELKLLADRAELKGAKFFYTALKSQGKAVKAYLTENGLEMTIENISRILPAEPLQKAMIQYYQLTGTDTAKWQYRFLRENNPIKSIGTDIGNLFNGWIRSVQLYVHGFLGQMITEINTTTLDRILKVLVEGRDQDYGAYKIASMIEAETEGRISKARALVIARTEGTRAASYGHKIASEGWARETGQRQFKEWVPIVDNRTRFDHLVMDKQAPIAAELKFNVGGFSMDAPGDISAPAKETINCRCRCVYLSERMVSNL